MRDYRLFRVAFPFEADHVFALHSAMHPSRFETRFTADFVCRFLPSGDERILEVGCGEGELAALLRQLGFQVNAVGSDEESIAAAPFARTERAHRRVGLASSQEASLDFVRW